MLNFIKKRRRCLEDWLARTGRAHTFSMARYQLHRATRPLVERRLGGRCLDAGSGHSPYKRLLAARGATVVSIDIEDRAGEIDIIADLQDMPAVADASMDSALCTQALEHVPRPWDALSELARVLKPGGHLVLSAPHLSAIHEAPHDYYRFTRHGLQSLLESRGFEALEIRPAGGLIAFLAHYASYALLCTLGAAPGLGRITWLANYIFLVRLAEPIERLLGARDVLPIK
jgi:SAM-dependent methyltransferase